MGAAPAAAVPPRHWSGPRRSRHGWLNSVFSAGQRRSYARLAAGLHPVGAVLLAIFGAPAAIPFVLLHGGGNGLLTIARGTLPLALFGAAGYGLRTGLLAAPARILQGAAPLLFGLVLDRGGPFAALLLSGSLTAFSLLALLLLQPSRHRAPLQSLRAD